LLLDHYDMDSDAKATMGKSRTADYAFASFHCAWWVGDVTREGKMMRDGGIQYIFRD